MRRLLDSLLSRWYVPRRVYELESAIKLGRVTRFTVDSDTFYVDADGNYWPVAPTFTHRGTPCS